MANDNRQRLMEIMGKLDKTFKPKLNEDFEIEVNDDEKSEEKEKPEAEGNSYKAKLEEINKLAKAAGDKLPKGEIPSWAQDKIIIAKEHLKDINSWLHVEEEENEASSEEHEEQETPKEEHEEHESEKEEKEEDADENGSNEKEEVPEPKKIPVVDFSKSNK